MLFPYLYVQHQMEKMQAFIDFIFYEVWCKAPIGLAFHPDLFDESPELKEVMVEFGFSAKAAERGKVFYRDTKAIYEMFASLTAQQVDQFKRWYQSNNDLERVCENDPTTCLARYTDIAVNHQDLAAQLGTFFKELYSQSLLDLAALRAKIGDIDDHYLKFVKKNRSGICPFCGISDMKGEHHSKREAYDHYLPKSLYPFNSINFRNLVPVCHECNSAYKGVKDPAYNSVGRRKAFYSFTEDAQAIEIEVALGHFDIENLKPADVRVQFGPAVIAEKIDTWKDVYGIEERYKAKICGDNGGKYWLMQVLDEWKEGGRDPADFLATIARQSLRSPYADCNFLRKPFLDACTMLGVI